MANFIRYFPDRVMCIVYYIHQKSGENAKGDPSEANEPREPRVSQVSRVSQVNHVSQE